MKLVFPAPKPPCRAIVVPTIISFEITRSVNSQKPNKSWSGCTIGCSRRSHRVSSSSLKSSNFRNPGVAAVRDCLSRTHLFVLLTAATRPICTSQSATYNAVAKCDAWRSTRSIREPNLLKSGQYGAVRAAIMMAVGSGGNISHRACARRKSAKRWIAASAHSKSIPEMTATAVALPWHTFSN